jgi:hypothetical protein
MAQATTVTDHAVGSNKTAARNYTWMSKFAMCKEFGDVKAAAKIASATLLTRADPDTNLDDDDNKEYKVFSDIGGIEESDKHQHKLTSMQDVDAANKEAMASAIDTLDSMATNMAGNVNMATVKPEAASGSKDVGKVAVEGNAANATTVVAEHNNKKTFDALLDDVENETRKVLRNVAEAIATLKIMLEQTKAEKYTVELHAYISKLIPSMVSMHKKVEKITVDKIEDQAVLLVISATIDNLYAKFNDLAEWRGKFSGGAKKKRKSTG